MNNKITLPIVIALILCVTVWGFAGAPKTFTDLKKDHWAYQSVSKMSETGIITGYPDGSFKPNNYVTYAEFIKMAVVSSTDEDPGVAGGGNHWGKNYYDIGYEKGWYNENDVGINVLNHPIDRQHMALIASKIINIEEEAVKDYSLILDSISDVEATDRYEFEIVTAYGAGILSGYGDGTFKPEGTLTRAESASVIQRLVDESARTVPDGKKLEKDIEERKAQEEAEKNRPKSKLETIKENAKAVTTFNPKTDILADGTMSEEKSIEYMDKVIDSLVFSGSNGQYYMSVTFPELPEGFKWRFNMSASITNEAMLKDDKRSWYFTTEDAYNPEQIIKAVGTVKGQIKGFDSLKDLASVMVDVEIRNKDNDVTYKYKIIKGYDGDWLEDQYLRITNLRTYEVTVYDYDINRHFTWK